MPCDTGWKRHSSVKKDKKKDEKKVSERPLYTKRQRMLRYMSTAKKKTREVAGKTRYHGTKAVQSYKYKYLCPYHSCTYATNNKETMKEHMKAEHKGTAPITKSRYYKFIK